MVIRSVNNGIKLPALDSFLESHNNKILFLAEIIKAIIVTAFDFFVFTDSVIPTQVEALTLIADVSSRCCHGPFNA